MHRLAGALGQPFQMQLCHAHDVHAVDDAAGQFKHFQGQTVASVVGVLHGVAQPHKACQQPVGGAFGKAGVRRKLLQARPAGMSRQRLDDAKNALHALHAVLLGHGRFTSKIHKKFIFSVSGAL